jgi:hypothetical protein
MFGQELADCAMQLGWEIAREDRSVVEGHCCTMLSTHSDVRELMLLMVVEPQAVACELCPAWHLHPFPIGTRFCRT